jgi:hypothetical protein
VDAIWRDFEGNPGPLHAADLPALREQPGDESWKPSNLTTENAWQHFGLLFISAIVNENARTALDLPCPKIAFPSAHPDKAKIVQVDVAIVALLNVPEQNGFAKAIIRRLGEGAGTCDRAAAVVEPVASNLPAGNLGHENLRWRN